MPHLYSVEFNGQGAQPKLISLQDGTCEIEQISYMHGLNIGEDHRRAWGQVRGLIPGQHQTFNSFSMFLPRRDFYCPNIKGGNPLK